jgi:hypothetical protein
MADANYGRLVQVVRVLLGAVLTINGLNWWIKLITPYPSISDGIARLPPGDVVAAMIHTGFMFHVVKALELVAGLGLLANRGVPLLLLAVLPVSVNVFMVDVFIVHRLRGITMGSGALLLNAFLMLAYLQHYRPMLVLRATPDRLGSAPSQPPILALMEKLRPLLAIFATALGLVMLGWLAVLVVQHFSA